MLDWSEIIAELVAHAESSGLKETATRLYEANFANEGGVIDGWAAADLHLEFHSHKLAFAHPQLAPFVETTFRLLASSDGIEVGSYRLISNLGTTTWS